MVARGRTGPTPSSPLGGDELFILKLINRPILVLRGLDGFVCHRRGSNQLDTNRSTYDVFHLSFKDGAYQIRGAGTQGAGRQWWGTGDARAPVNLQPCPQAAELASGTLAATGACAATAIWRRISSSSSESVAASPSAPSVASTCVAALQGCCVLTRTCLRGKLFGNIEDSQGGDPRAPPLNLCCVVAVGLRRPAW